MFSLKRVIRLSVPLLALGAAGIGLSSSALGSNDDRAVLLRALEERFHPIVEQGIRATCPKDGSSWHEHQSDDIVTKGPFREDSVAFCDSYLTARQRLDSGNLSPWNAYEFYAYRRDYDLDNRYIRLLVGPFLGRRECDAHRIEVIKSQIDVTLCQPVALN